jgi:L-rhamnose-H+ transport protein
MNTTLGTLLCAAGGLAGAVFALPFRGIKSMKYESYWLVYAIAGLVLFPLALGLSTGPLFDIIKGTDSKTLARCMLFGALWGFGGLTWGLMIRYLGIGLGLAIGCGLCSATGTLIPPIVTGNAGALVAAGDALAVTFQGVGGYDGDALVFRPFEPRLVTSAVLAWKRHRAFSEASRVFLDAMKAQLEG